MHRFLKQTCFLINLRYGNYFSLKHTLIRPYWMSNPVTDLETIFGTQRVSYKYYRTTAYHNYVLQPGMLVYMSSVASLENET